MVIQINPTFKNTIACQSCKNINVHRSCRRCSKRPPKKALGGDLHFGGLDCLKSKNMMNSFEG